MIGFEPTTFCSQNRHATKLRYILCIKSLKVESKLKKAKYKKNKKKKDGTF